MTTRTKTPAIGEKLNDVVVNAIDHPRTTIGGIVLGASLITPAVVSLANGGNIVAGVGGIVAGVAAILGGILAADAGVQ
jgi:hypothetical protein